MKKITFILSTWGDSHQMTRMISFEKEFKFIKRLAYIRNYYPSGYDSREKTIIGNLENGKYFNRIISYIKVFFTFLSINKKNEDLFYIFGFDNLILFKLACFFSFQKPKIIYEIADIREIQYSDSTFGKIVKRLDCKIVKSVDLLVVTSLAYVKEFYEKNCNNFCVNHFLLENKIHTDFHEKASSFLINKIENKKAYKFTIGYFGLIRCTRSLQVLIQFAKQNQDVLIIIRGLFMDSTKSYLEEIQRTNNIKYLGTYVSPVDLQNMYNEVDLSWICYPFSNTSIGNWQWARTNRYYEGGFYLTPMVAAKGTKDAVDVEKYDIGFVISLDNIEEAIRELNKVTTISIKSKSENISKLNKNLFEITNDYETLFKKIKNIL